MYVARYGGEIGGSNTIQKIANKNKWLLRPRVHTILVNLRQPSTTPPPHHTPTWQIKALLMLAPSVVTPQNQYFPANAERMSVHCLESGCIGKYTPLGPRDFPRAGILHPPLGNLLGLGGGIFRYIPTRGSVRTFFHHYQGTIDFVA